jgi:hypothetical protein
METMMDYLVCAVLTGAGATALMDLWTVARERLLGIPFGYGPVGRWLAHLVRGRFFHYPIAATPAVRGERLIGWTAHYLIGIAFAAILPALWGLDWARQPTLGPALIVGVGSVAAPFRGDATGHGRRHRRQPHAAPRRGAFPEPRHARDFRPRPVRRRLDEHAYLFVLGDENARFPSFSRRSCSARCSRPSWSPWFPPLCWRSPRASIRDLAGNG